MLLAQFWPNVFALQAQSFVLSETKIELKQSLTG